MNNNLKPTKLNKSVVVRTGWMSVLAFNVIVIICVGMYNTIEYNELNIESFFYISLCILIFGIVFWLPSALINLGIEHYFLKENSTQVFYLKIMAIEMLIPFLALVYFIYDYSGAMALIYLLALIGANWIRWIYIKRKGGFENYDNTEQIDSDYL